jgi:predicted nucleic acid-binding protein
MIRTGKIDLAWSYILDFENEANPFFERKYTIEKWRDLSIQNIVENGTILITAAEIKKNGIKPKDALHLACAIEMGCEYFLTTDYILERKAGPIDKIKVLNPIEFTKITEQL